MTDNKIKMPVWGPYSKKYMGISKIINELADKGARYDFSIHPTLWNSSTPERYSSVKLSLMELQKRLHFLFIQIRAYVERRSLCRYFIFKG